MSLCGEPLAGDQTCALQANHIVPCSPDPDGGWIPMPTQPFVEVVPRLYIGGTMNALGQILDPADGDFDSVLTLYRSAPFCAPPINERRFIFGDGRTVPDNIDDAVAWVWGQWAVQKRHTLVRCQAGLNRSGLIVALTLMKDGHDVDDAIRLIREKRSEYALINRFFVDYLRSRP